MESITQPVPRKFDIRTDPVTVGSWLDCFIDKVRRDDVVAYNLDKQYALVYERDTFGDFVFTTSGTINKKIVNGHIEVRWKTGAENMLSGILS